MTRRRCLGIHHHGEGRLGDPGRDEARCHIDRVASRPAAGGISGIEQNHRPALKLPATPHGFCYGDGLDEEVQPAGPVAVRQTFSLPARQCAIAVGDNERAAAHLADVDIGADVKQGNRQYARLRLERTRGALEPGEGSVSEGRRVIGGEDQGKTDATQRRTDLAACGAQKQARRAFPRGEAVIVGIVLVTDNQVQALDHPVGDVAVQIERHRHGHGRADDGPHAGSELAFGIVAIGRDHRAVTGEQHCIDGACLPEHVEHAIAQIGVGVGLEDGGRIPAGREQRDDGDARLAVEYRERPGELGVGAAE
jgi:hypothetical protein